VPLKALVDGTIVTAPDLSGGEWNELALRHRNGTPVTMCCCGAPGHLRVSQNGVRHFYHAASSACGYAEESAEHLALKEQIYRACRAEGWEVSVEYPAPDRSWVADVYAAGDGREVVFEIQISAIPPEELEERETRYRDGGIESYWLLDRFLGRSRDFTRWYDTWIHEGDERPGKAVPYLDPSLLETGPENHIFVPKGIRSIGLDAKNRTLFSTNNPAIPPAVWAREVLNGNYRRYLDETSRDLHRKRRLRNMAAPALVRFRDFYRQIVRDRTFRNKAESLSRSSGIGTIPAGGRERRDARTTILSEIEWLENEYRSFLDGRYGLFTWKESPGTGGVRPFFRLESEQKVQKLQKCVRMLDRWEESFDRALTGQDPELSGGPAKKPRGSR